MTDLLVLKLVDGSAVHVRPERLVVAGYTGRDPALVQRHIDELAAVGIPPPESVPVFYELDPGLLTSDREVRVQGDRTCGEVEPVIVFADSGPLLTVGSDHTDRELERRDVAKSKAVCPKVLGRDAVPLDLAAAAWDQGRLTSWVGDRIYQDAPLSMITPPREIIEKGQHVVGEFVPGTVLFLGTVPLLGEFDYRSTFTGRLHIPGGPPLDLEYHWLFEEEPR